jgi:hypothetical protein
LEWQTNPNNKAFSEQNDDEMEFRDQYDEYVQNGLFSEKIRSRSFSISSEFQSCEPLEIGKVVSTKIGEAKIVNFNEPMKPVDEQVEEDKLEEESED